MCSTPRLPITDDKLTACSPDCSEVGGPNPEALATIAQVVAQMSAAAERSARAKRHKIAKVSTHPSPIIALRAWTVTCLMPIVDRSRVACMATDWHDN